MVSFTIELLDFNSPCTLIMFEGLATNETDFFASPGVQEFTEPEQMATEVVLTECDDVEGEHVPDNGPSNVHPMVTRSEASVFKPKVFATDVSVVGPSNIHQVMGDSAWKTALHVELQALHKNGTWKLVVPPDNRVLVGCKWIFKLNRNSDGSIARHKARLMAQGYSQVAGVDYHETFSPMVKANTVRTMIGLVVSQKWKLRQIDVNNAFLN